MRSSLSIWSGASVEAPGVTRLDSDASADVCVVGAGIAGLLTALRLLRAGRSVVVLDQSGVWCGETRQTTAHLTRAIDPGYTELESIHGVRKTRTLAEAHAYALLEIERLVTELDIECDFQRVDGYLFEGGMDPSGLDAEARAARRAGVECELVARAPLPFAAGRALRFSEQAQLHPVKFCAGILRSIVASGGRVHAPARVVGLEKRDLIAVRTLAGPSVHARDVVVATNTPINDVMAMHTKQAAYRSYALAAPIPSGALVPGLFWDRETPYHYVRTLRDPENAIGGEHDVIIVGGEDHKVGQEAHPELAWTRLERWLAEHFSEALAPHYRWSGQILEPADGVAFIGRNPGDLHVFIVTGQSGNGITYAAVAARLIADLIDERESDWEQLFDPGRKPTALRALGSFVRENLNVARHYTDWLTGDGEKNIERGEGAVVRRGLRKIAVYVDEQGRSHELSAKCPHLGCVVAWNRAEKTWDCPCHGSRFDAYGHVRTGPAVRDMEPVQPPDGVDRREPSARAEK